MASPVQRVRDRVGAGWAWAARVRAGLCLIASLCVCLAPASPVWSQTAPCDPVLVAAVKLGDLAQVKTLIACGTDVNAADDNGAPPLMWAVYKGRLDIARILVKAGADPTRKGLIWLDGQRKSWYGSTLCAAAGEGDLNAVKYLLEELQIPADDRELDDSRRPAGWTPLLWASAKKRSAVVETLVASGADLNVQDSKGLTPLMLSASSGDQRSLRILVEHGARRPSNVEREGLRSLSYYVVWRDRPGQVSRGPNLSAGLFGGRKIENSKQFPEWSPPESAMRFIL
jgi:ankyrin repeat protein